MSTFELRAHTDRDGRLILFVPPDLADSDVRVLVEHHARPSNTSPASTNGKHESWPEFLGRTYGSIPDFPDVPRPGPDADAPRETWP